MWSFREGLLRAAEGHGENLLIHGGPRRGTENTFLIHGGARRGTENTFLIHGGPRRGTENTFLIHGGPRRGTENTFLIHGGPRELQGIVAGNRCGSGGTDFLGGGVLRCLNQDLQDLRIFGMVGDRPSVGTAGVRGQCPVAGEQCGGGGARFWRGALRGVTPRTREGRRREQQFLVVSFLFLVNPARTRRWECRMDGGGNASPEPP